MNNQKTGNTLNLALDATSREREASMNLNAGYEKETQRWKLIIRYFGAASELETDNIVITPLLGNYGIADIPQDQIEGFAQNPAVEYIEAPKRLYFAAYEGRQTSCVNPVQNQSPYLFGKGILIACIDSGVDYTHPDFRNEDGSTRILRLWDQSIPGNPPKGYRIGSEYTQEQINRALEANTMAEREALVPNIDTSGHGTAVLGIAAGNGRESQGTERGVAPESSLLVVKLGIRDPNGFPRTTELMQGVDYAIRTAQELQMPVVINLSFGNSYGAHNGTSLVETYLNQAVGYGRVTLCVGTGNEGNRAGHTAGRVRQGENYEAELGIGTYEPAMNLQIWKNYQDQMEISLVHPDGTIIGPLEQTLGTQRYRHAGTDFRNYINMNSQKEVTRGQISGAISQLIDSKEIIRVGRGLYSKDTQSISIKKTTNDEAEDTLKNNIYNTLSKIEDELMNAIGAVNVWEVNSDNFAVITKMRELKDSIEEIKRQCQ